MRDVRVLARQTKSDFKSVWKELNERRERTEPKTKQMKSVKRRRLLHVLMAPPLQMACNSVTDTHLLAARSSSGSMFVMYTGEEEKSTGTRLET